MTSEDITGESASFFDETYGLACGGTASNENICKTVFKAENDTNEYDNKNRHNKNVVIWKDGYIIPLNHASVQIDDLQIDEIFQSPPETLSLDRSPSIYFSDNEEGSVFVEECQEHHVVAKSKSEPLYHELSMHEEHEFDNVDLPSSFSEDIGSRLTASFRCKRSECECPYKHSPLAECKKALSACEFHRHSRPSYTQDSNKFDVVSDDKYGDNGNHTQAARAPQHESEHGSNMNDGMFSERSSYSTDPGDADNGYEIIDWDSDWEFSDCSNFVDRPSTVENEDINRNYSLPKATTPCECTGAQSLQFEDKDFCVVEKSGSSLTCTSQTDVSSYNPRDTNTDLQQNEAGCAYSDKSHGRSNNAVQSVCASNEHIQDSAADTTTRKSGVTAKVQKNRTQGNFTRRRHSYSQRRHAAYTDESPTLIDAQSIQYEADPKTGKVLTVGKGSFGQVFKARFYDPRFRHLRIVVKEFDEDFTNKHEIVEEAQKLLYLRDTGYVPMCYGLVNLGAQSEPRYGIVQEYIGSGLTLEQLLWEQYDLPMEMWLSIALQCCEGLDRFHNKGILLNDIKSNNIILEFGQESVRIKYIDFGLATDMRGKRYKNTKSLEDFVYLAPEVRIHGQVTTIATDVYSLGYMLEQINGSACIPELKFVAGICMKTVSEERTLVSVAASFIGNYMNRLGCDTQFSKGFDFMFSTGFW